MGQPGIRSMQERTYQLIPMDRIAVLNSRKRDQDQFRENVRSISDIGLLKPIVVSERVVEGKATYELVCGEGRFLAYQKLGRAEIPAEVLHCDRKTALLYSLVENMARVPPGTMWFAREVKRMRDEGWPYADICRVTGKSESYLHDYVRLAEHGEERLISGVERGLFSMSFALMVARSDSGSVQHLLMDAFDKGIVNSANLPTVRRIVERRLRDKRDRTGEVQHTGAKTPTYSVQQLRKDIEKVTRDKEAFVREAGLKENRLMALAQDLQLLWGQADFVDLVRQEGLEQWPELKGNYNV